MTKSLLKLRLLALTRASVFLSILSLWTFASCFAQEKQKATFGKIFIGGNFVDLSSFNEALEVNEFAGIKEAFFTAGLGVDRFQGRWYYGGEMYNYMVNESGVALKARDHAVLGYHYLSLKTGFVAFSKARSYSVYPTVGVGGGIAHLQTRKQSETISTVYWAKGLFVDMAIKADLFSIMDEEKSYFLTAGLSVGYLRKLGNDWLVNGFGQTDTGIPVTPQGLYIRASLGMGKMK